MYMSYDDNQHGVKNVKPLFSDSRCICYCNRLSLGLLIYTWMCLWVDSQRKKNNNNTALALYTRWEVQCCDSSVAVSEVMCATSVPCTYQKSSLHFIKQWNFCSISSCAVLLFVLSFFCHLSFYVMCSRCVVTHSIHRLSYTILKVISLL